MDMMRIFVFNMKKYRKKRGFSQKKLADMLATTTSYIGEIEICNKVPSLGMVEKIAKALEIEPFWLFVDDKDRVNRDTPLVDNCLEGLSALDRQELAKYISDRVSNEIARILNPESAERTP